jgi:hypothetical protein
MPRTQPTDLFLFFDLGKVLVAFDHQVMVENLASLLSVPCESVWDLLFDQGLEDAYERGDITSETFAARLLAIGRHPVRHGSGAAAVPTGRSGHGAALQYL